MAESENPKLCLSCARARMSGKVAKPCGDCVLLNIDPLAKVRANAALPSPLLRFSLMDSFLVSENYGPSLKPARPTPSGRGG